MFCKFINLVLISFLFNSRIGFSKRCFKYNPIRFSPVPQIQQLTLPLEHSEGPYWDSEKQLLFFVDIAGHRVYKYDPFTEKLTYADVGDVVSVVVPISNFKNKFLIGKGTDLSVLTWDGEYNSASPLIKNITTVDKNKPPGNRFNDGKADAIGRLWIGTMGKEDPIGTVVPNRGTLYRAVNESCKLEPVVHNVSISNGLVWSLNNKIMYYIDSPLRRVDQFDYNIINGDIRNRRTLIDFEKENVAGTPDGMTIDNEGNLWVACWGGSQIINVDSQTGKVIFSISMPVERVTSLVFGGTYYDTLFVTSMRVGLTPAQLESQPAAGAVFAVSNLPTIGYAGTPASGCVKVY